MAIPYQISLKSVLVIENGTIEDEEGNNGLRVSMHNPDIGKISVVSVRQLKLEDNVEFDYTREHYKNRILFKENILHDTLVEVELTSIKEPKKLNLLLFKGLEKAISKIDRILPGGAVSGVVKKTSETLLDIIEPEDKIEIIGRQEIQISESIGDKDYPFQLSVPKKIELKKISRDEQGQIVKKTKTIKKGFTNGQVVLEFKKLSH